MADSPTGSPATPTPPNTAPGAVHADSGMTLSRYSVLVGAGAFATTFAQMRILAKFPVTFLLKDHFHMKQEQVAVFARG